MGRIFRELYGFAGEPSVRGPYRPLTTLSYALDYAVHGRWTPGYHLVNVALHGLASLLVLAVARRLAAAAWPQEAGGPGRAARVALLAGLLFAVHPAHVEAVASIFGRTEPLSTSFALGALLLALGRRGAAWRLPAALLVLVAGVLSKEVAIVTPGIFLVIAVALPAAAGFEVRPGLRGAAPRRALAEAAALAGLLATALVPYLLARGPVLGVAPEARWFPVGTPAAHVALTMSRVLGEYLRILAFPAFLGGDFAYAARLPTLTGPTAGFALATAAWLATLAAGLLLLRRAPLAAAGLLWIFLPLLPVLQVIPVGVLLAERLLYLPSVGFCLAVAAALGGWLGRGPAAARAAAAGLALVAALAGRTVARTLDWRTAVAYWEAELATAPREVVVNNNLAVAYLARGRFAEAVERLRVVLEVHPRYWRAHINMGLALQSLGDKAAGDGSRAGAAAQAADLEARSGQRVPLHAELVERPRGTLQVFGEAGLLGEADLVAALDVAGDAGAAVEAVAHGLDGRAAREDRRYRGRLLVTVDAGGALALVNLLPLEALLRGLVPSEMPAGSPLEALKAQAVTARSNVLAQIGTRHLGDPYLLCAEVHCQAYRGTGAETLRTDEAVRATAGEALFGRADRTLVDGVYSAMCGGHGEDAHLVWGGGPRPGLGGHPDLPAALRPIWGGGLRDEARLRDFLAAPPDAWCARPAAARRDRFRWERRFAPADLDGLASAAPGLDAAGALLLWRIGILEWILAALALLTGGAALLALRRRRPGGALRLDGPRPPGGAAPPQGP